MTRIKNISEEKRNYFQKFYPKHEVVGLLEEDDLTRVIVKGGGWTPTGCARDCGDHLIVALHSRYDRIDKGTLERTKDVEDR